MMVSIMLIDSLAQYDTILQSHLEVFSDWHARYILNPVLQLLLLLQVVLLSNLQGAEREILKTLTSLNSFSICNPRPATQKDVQLIWCQ